MSSLSLVHPSPTGALPILHTLCKSAVFDQIKHPLQIPYIIYPMETPCFVLAGESKNTSFLSCLY